MNTIYYSSFGCQYSHWTKFTRIESTFENDSSGIDQQDSGYVATGPVCSVITEEIIQDSYRKAQISLIVLTIPTVILWMVVLNKKLRAEYEKSGNDWKVLMTRANMFILVNATLYLLTHFLWCVDPNWANDSYGTVLCGLIRIIPPVSAFNMICAYMYRFQVTLNELISRSSHSFKKFSMASTLFFFLSTVVLVAFEIAVKDATIPVVVWSSFFLIYSIINLGFAGKVSAEFYKTQRELKNMNRLSTTNSYLWKALSVTFGLSVTGIVFFIPYMIASWGKLLDPSKKAPEFFTASDVQGEFLFAVSLYQVVSAIGEYSVIWTHFSWKRTADVVLN